MGGLFHEAAYPPLGVRDFGPGLQHCVTVHHGGRTVAIGDHTDIAFQLVPTWVIPGSAVDLVIHGLPGRFIDKLRGRLEIPVPVVVELLRLHGVAVRTPLRLLTCHGAEPPLVGSAVASELAKQWQGIVTAANGLLRIIAGQGMRIDLVEWEIDPVLGGMMPDVIGQGKGDWLDHHP